MTQATAQKQKTEDGGQIRFEMVDIKSVVSDGENHRAINTKDPELMELVESVAAGGIRVPLIVRGRDMKANDTHRLIAGHRRLLAAAMAGLTMVPVIIHDGINEATAEDIAYIENKFREDLTPLEEAEQVVTLLGKYKGDAAAVASRLGRPLSWVTMRANVLKSLIEPWKKAVLKDNREFGNYTIAHLALVARLPADTQKQLLADADPEWSVRELDKTISQQLRLVSKMPWDIGDDTLVAKMPSCLKCTKRSSTQPLLFYDAVEQATNENDLCLDGACFNKKEEAHLKKQIAAARKEHPNLVTISTKPGTSYYEDEKLKAIGSGFLRPYQYKPSKEGAKGARPAMVLDGSEAGCVKYITVNREGSAGGEKRASVEGEKKHKTLKEKQDTLNRKRMAMVITELIDKVDEIPYSAITFDNKPATVLALAACYGSESYDVDINKPIEFVRLCGTSKDGTVKAAETIWPCVRNMLSGELRYGGPPTQMPDENIELAKFLGAVLDIDIEKMLADVAARPEFAEPKSWEKKQQKAKSK